MAILVEWQLPYTAWDWIEITAKKVIKVLLREENNLIKLNDENELYTDLQLASWIKPTDEFPVGVTVWQVLKKDWWLVNGTILNFQTTSGDYGRWLYWADGHMYYDDGTWTFTQIYSWAEVDALFTQLRSELSTVAFTWDYNDLLNRPTIVNPNDWELTISKNWEPVWTFTANQQEDETINIEVPTTVAELTDADEYAKFTDLAPVATSNDYNDLDNKPTIPVVNDATLTIQKNGTNVATFTANQSTNQTANITVPTTVAELTDSADYVTDTELSNALEDYTPTADLAAVALSNDYSDLDNKPTIWDATITIQKNWTNVDSFKVNTTSDKNINLTLNKSDVGLSNVDNTSDLNKPISTATQTALNLKANSADLATVATSWSYNDLSNKPTIPSVIDNLTSTDTNNALSAAQGKELNDKITVLQARGRFLSNWNASTWLPVSFPESTPYTYRTWDYFDVTVVGSSNKKPSGATYTWAASTTAETEPLAVWDTYIYDGTNWLLQLNHNITTTFATISWQPTDNTNLAAALNAKANSADLATVATSGSYSDLSNKPTIWTATITIQKNSTTVDSFGVNTTSNKTINIWVPTTVAELTDSADYVKDSELATVATTWDYSDLSGTPNLATVATSWSYNDLSNKPTIWTANLTIQKNWTNVATFWANATTWVTANITVPTKTSDLTNDSNFVVSTDLASVATSGSYTDLSNKPTIDTSMSDSSTNAVQNKVIKAYIDSQSWSAADAKVSDTAYWSSWNWVTGIAPSKNAMYDKISAMDTTIAGKADSSSLATVATSGSYSDLSNKPTIPAAQVQTDWNATSWMASIKNKPTLATVATSGSYNDLSNKPTIPAAQVNSDWNATSGVAQILNKPTLATVATSGSYNDLSNKPTIPTVNNWTLTINQGWTSKWTFTANQSGASTVNLETWKLVTQTEYNNISWASSDWNLYIIYKTV